MKPSLLLTGASGFLGRAVRPDLEREYTVSGLGRGASNDISVDLAHDIPHLPARFEVVVHMAAVAHLNPHDQLGRQLISDVNLGGTQRLCAALEQAGLPSRFVFISSVAVYGAVSGCDIDTTAPLGGTSSYARSKIEAERLLTSWCAAHHVTLTIIRSPLILGLNPPGTLGEMTRAIARGCYMNIADGRARRSVLRAQSMAPLILRLMDRGGIYNVCEADTMTISEIAKEIAERLDCRHPRSLPFWLARILALSGDCIGRRAPFNSQRLHQLTSDLTFVGENPQ